MVRVEGHRLIRVPSQKVYKIVSKVESIPRYAELWLTADVLEQKRGSALVHLQGYIAGMPVESIHRITLQAQARVEFRQVRGTLKTLRGEFRLKEVNGETELALHMEAEAGISVLPETSVQHALYLHVERTLDRVKATAERELRTPRRSKERVSTEEEEEEQEQAEATPQPSSTPSADQQRPPQAGRKRRRRRRRRGKLPPVQPQPAQ